MAYNSGDGAGTVTDNKTYNHGAYADVKPGTGITPPTGQVFLGWTLQGDTSGKVYVANDKIYMDGNKTLTAAFGPKILVTLTYTANNGLGDDVVISLQNNQQHTIRSNEYPTYTREGYQFIGWNTYSDGSGKTYKPGQTVIVDVGENVLYAMWEALIPITATKEWDFPLSGIGIERPIVYFTLYRVNAEGPPDTKIGTEQVPDAYVGASVTWANQLQTDGNGYTYQYYVKETTADGTDYTPPSFSKVESGLSVTNTYNYIDFTATKVWANAALVEIKPNIQLQLQVSTDGENYTNQGAPVTLTHGTTEYTWYNLPQQNAQGQGLTYRAREVAVPESYEVAYTDGTNATTITNTYQSVSFTVTKNWEVKDSLTPPATWPEIQLQLYQNGQPFRPYQHVPGQAANTFTHTWDGLPKYDINGAEYSYTARELVIPGGYAMTAVDGVDGNNLPFTTITNTKQPNTLTGTKVWQGDQPDDNMEVTLELYQTIKVEEGDPPSSYHKKYDEVIVKKEDGWQHTWDDLPASGTVDDQEVNFEYEITENPVPIGYYYDTVSSASLNVINVSQKISFTATKIWSGGINNRPEEITLYLERREIREDGTPMPEATWEKVSNTDYDLPKNT